MAERPVLPQPPESELGSFDAVADTDTVARASRHTLLAQVAVQGSRLAVSVVLARLLTPSDFGVVAAAMVVMVVAWQLTDLGTSAVIIQRDTVDDSLVSSLFYVNLLLGAGLSAATVAVATPLATALGQPSAGPAIRVLAAVSFLGALGNMHYALIRRTMQFGRLATMNIANAVVSGSVGIALAAAGGGIWALVIGTVAGTGVTTATAWRYEPWRPSATFDLQRLRGVARFSVEFFFTSVIAAAIMQVDKVIVSRVLGGAALGVYTIAQRTVTAPVNTVSEAVSTVAFSTFARQQKNPEALRAGVARAAGVVALVLFPSMVGLAVLAEPAVAVVYGPRWEAVVPVIWVLAPVCAVQAISRVTSCVILALGRTDWLFRWGLAYGAATVCVQLVTVRWGLLGVSLGLAIVVAVLTPIESWMALRLVDMRLRDLLMVLLPHVLITGSMGAAAWGSATVAEARGAGALLQLITGTCVGASLYLGLLVLLRVPALDDARRVLGRWAVRST